MTPTGNYIAGAWTPARGANEHVSYNPATGEVIETSATSNTTDVDAAVAAARASFRSWNRTPDAERGEMLFRVAEQVRANRQSLAELMTREMGKPLVESFGEIDTVIAHAQYMAGEGRRALGEVLPSARTNRVITTKRHPRGVVACITPWNFPIVLAAYKIFAALIGGNTVVWKPAPNVSQSARMFTQAFEAAGVQPGVLNVLCAGGVEAGEALVAHPDVAVVAFTGSTPVGKSIARVCADRLAPTVLELGGKNAIMVMDDANLDDAVAGIIQSGFATSGQRCTAASRIIVHEAVAHELTERLDVAIAGFTLGNGLDPATTLGPLALESQVARIEAAVNRAVSQGATLVTGGQRAANTDAAHTSFFAPTLLTRVDAHHEIAQHEVFGPVLTLIEVANLDDAIAANNSTEFGLSSAIYTESLAAALRASQECESGLVYVNSGTSAAEIGVPFGGVKDSGNGHAEVSRHALDAMTYLKATYISFDGGAA
jgi:acyl-CoA reductase-like NAD-dependent aldehyde dehydrogenase